MKHVIALVPRGTFEGASGCWQGAEDRGYPALESVGGCRRTGRVILLSQSLS